MWARRRLVIGCVLAWVLAGARWWERSWRGVRAGIGAERARARVYIIHHYALEVMNRRRYLATGAAALLAGCSTSPEFEAVGISAPNRVDLGESLEFEIKIKNTALVGGTYEGEYQLDRPGYMFKTTEQFELDVDGNGTASHTVTVQTEGIGKITLQHGDASAFVVVGPATLSVGEWFESPQGLRVRLSTPVFSRSYSWEGYYSDETEEAPDGEVFAFVRIDLENRSSGERRLPDGERIHLVTEDDRFSPANLQDIVEKTYFDPVSGEEYYRRGLSQIPAGDTRVRWLRYSVPADAKNSLDRLDARWEDSAEVRLRAQWTL